MPTIYITDQSREKLDTLTDAEKRNLSDEIDFLLDNRLKELNLPVDTHSSSEAKKSNSKDVQSQEK